MFDLALFQAFKDSFVGRKEDFINATDTRFFLKVLAERYSGDVEGGVQHFMSEGRYNLVFR